MSRLFSSLSHESVEHTKIHVVVFSRQLSEKFLNCSHRNSWVAVVEFAECSLLHYPHSVWSKVLWRKTEAVYSSRTSELCLSQMCSTQKQHKFCASSASTTRFCSLNLPICFAGKAGAQICVEKTSRPWIFAVCCYCLSFCTLPRPGKSVVVESIGRFVLWVSVNDLLVCAFQIVLGCQVPIFRYYLDTYEPFLGDLTAFPKVQVTSLFVVLVFFYSRQKHMFPRTFTTRRLTHSRDFHVWCTFAILGSS